MTNDRPVYILPLVNYNVYWPIIGHFLFDTIRCFLNELTNQNSIEVPKVVKPGNKTVL